jgi:hypothetical protein
MTRWRVGSRPCGRPGTCSTSGKASCVIWGTRCCGSGASRCEEAPVGVELDQEFAIHGVAQDGKLTRVHTFLTWRAALDAVGLSE